MVTNLPPTAKIAKQQGITRYFTGKACCKGHIAERITSSGTCSVCNKRTVDEWMIKNHHRHLKKVREWQKNHPLDRLLSSIKRRANKSGLECTITKEHLVIPSHCPILGIELRFGGRTVHERRNSPSVDRIDNNKGYTPDNIQIISNHANFIKGGCVTAEDLMKVAQWMLASKHPL